MLKPLWSTPQKPNVFCRRAAIFAVFFVAVGTSFLSYSCPSDAAFDGETVISGALIPATRPPQLDPTLLKVPAKQTQSKFFDALSSKVTPISEELVKKYKLDTTFYKKHLDYRGFSIFSSAKVSDAGLYEARYLMHCLLHEREDIVKALIKSGTRFMVMAPTEMTTDVPEQRHMKNDPKTNWDQRARGLGGKLTSCGEENLLNLKGDRYNSENILIHEFNHAVHNQALRSVDPTFDGRLSKIFNSAKSKGLWKGTYLMENKGEYWAEACQAYFDTMRAQFAPKKSKVDTHNQMKEYDPDLYKLVEEVYKGSKYRYVRYDVRQKSGGPIHPDPTQIGNK
ncbi:MAG TPA: hypothetical protein VE988_09890 [Gemmataceae bacterium]|nr:hypothetical protein [Gemmataceae bacterium]